MAARKNTTSINPSADIVEIIEVNQGRAQFCVLGTTPLVLNRMSEKAKHELLLPKGRKNAVERATSLKHNPLDEYRASAYKISEDRAPTLLAILSSAFKGAMKTAALDLPGAHKSQIGRLVYVEDYYTGIFGVPQLFMAITRSADIKKTPDVRTRAIVPRWACKVTVSFVQPLMRPQAVANLLAAAGFTAGVGDGRPEKGALNFGQFKIVDAADVEFIDIIKQGGRAEQKAALQAPTCYDDETADLLGWFDGELSRRQIRGAA